MRLSNWKIGRKLAAAFAVVVALMVTVGALAVGEFRAINARQDDARASSGAYDTTAMARFYLTRQENSFRGYTITGEPYYRERLDAHRANFEKSIAELREAAGDNAEQIAQIGKADQAAEAWYQAVTGTASVAALRPAVGSQGTADEMMSGAEDALEATQGLFAAQRDTARELLSEAVQKGMIVISGGILLLALLSVGIAWLLTRAVARPLVGLTDAMGALVQNRLEGEIVGRERGDEIGAMARALVQFKQNADLLDASRAEAWNDAFKSAVIEFDLDGNILTANENFLNTVGYRLEEIKGRHHRLFCDSDYARSADYQTLWDTMKSGGYVADKFIRYGRDQRKVWLEASYNPILGPDGKPYKVVKFATDVTAAELARVEDEEAAKRLAQQQAVVVAETGRGLEALSAGDLTYRITADFPAEYVSVRDDFNGAMGKLEDAMGVITNNARAMQTGAGEISQAADDLSRRTEQQAATLEETAAALDQITATVRRTAEGAQRANVVVTDARNDAEVSGNVVAKAITAMGEIEASADQISQIIGVIDEIAFQTNLLALNAGVEAARAGDAGRGFAVVASEVRALAQRSAEAAKEIKTLISASTGQVKDGVSLVGQTGQALTAIVGRVSEINALMAEINASAQEQATALSQVNTAVNQMDQTTQQNAAMVEESTAASHNLTQEAAELARLVGRFQVGNQRPVEASADRHRAAPSPARAAQARVSEFASRQSMPRAAGNTALAVDSWEEF